MFTLQGLHMIADLSGWYLGSPTAATLPPPVNPTFGPATALELTTPSIGLATAVGTGANLDAVANLGIAATWNGAAELATPGNIVLFGHRTTHGAPFLNINLVPLGGAVTLTRRRRPYLQLRGRAPRRQTVPSFNVINNIGAQLRTGNRAVGRVHTTALRHVPLGHHRAPRQRHVTSLVGHWPITSNSNPTTTTMRLRQCVCCA